MSAIAPWISNGEKRSTAHIIGPTWSRNPETGKWVLPEFTLGWTVIEWMVRYLRQPDGPNAGQRLKLTNEQVRFLLWWYAVDATGRFLYTTGTLRRSKGTGKDPLGAMIAYVEMLGPAAFSHFDVNGIPVGKQVPAAWVQICATSRDQTQNTTRLWAAMASPKLLEDYNLEILKNTVRIRSGADVRSIDAVTSSPIKLEGARATFVLKNETQLWFSSNQGHAMNSVISGNATKIRGGQARTLSLCNAHIPGLDSVAERDYDAYQKMAGGQAYQAKVLYDSISAPADTDINDVESLRRGLEVARGDAVWLDIDRTIDEILNIANPIYDSRRKYLNQVLGAEDSWIDSVSWDKCADEELELFEDDVIALGFDGSKSKDATALVACRASDGALFLLGLWENPGGAKGKNWQVPSSEVDAEVEEAFNRYKVKGFYADVREWEDHIERWGAQYGKGLRVKGSARNPVAWDMRTRETTLVTQGMAFNMAIQNGSQLHDGDQRLRRHVLNAKRKLKPTTQGEAGFTFRKENPGSTRKIDALAAALLARMAWQDLIQGRKARLGTQRKTKVIVFDD